MSLHVLWARGHYRGQVREKGYRTWRTVPGRYKTAQRAAWLTVKSMTRQDYRWRVLFIDDNPYYEPHVAAEGRFL